jgi:hypothetical protein
MKPILIKYRLHIIVFFTTIGGGLLAIQIATNQFYIIYLVIALICLLISITCLLANVLFRTNHEK